MHGISRKAPTQKEQEALSRKAAKLGGLQSQLLQFHRDKIYTKEAVDVSTELLESNPEHYTGWNYRKLAVQHCLETAPDTDSIQSILDKELRVVENALKRNLKSYGAWHHRKWIISKGHSSTDKELRLLGKFQKLDSRNFHAWNYRRFITALKKIPDDEELEYTEDLMNDNFSNYSAWHNRSVLLSHLLAARGKGYNDKEIVVEQEFDSVRHALFTDPDDQSGWFYHLWLLDQTLKQEPQLLSSWPPLDSHIYLSINGFLDCQSSFHVLRFQSKTRMIPVILCFSEAVEGISSSTITVECEYHASDDLIWKPLSANKLGFAEVWLTYLNYPDEVNSVKAYPVKIIVANVPGVSSSSGMLCSTYHVSFTVCLPSHDQVHAKAQSKQRISWNEENFRTCDAQSEDLVLLHLLSKLKITSEGKPTTSDWSVKVLSTEIGHCLDLLSLTNCEIGKDTLARLLMVHTRLISCGRPNDGTEVHYEEILSLYQELLSSTNCKIGKDTLARLLMVHNRLISCGRPNDGTEVPYEEILSLYQELLSLTNCKIGKLTLARLYMAHNRLVSCGRPNDGTEVLYGVILSLYRDLMKMDPAHLCYYEDEYSLTLLKQVTSNTKSLLKYIYEFRGSTSVTMNSHLCLRLNNLSLSRIGSIECLLWVQMLDLSHNKIRSLEGLEALQLLSSLNLSSNKICSFLALDPLRSLKALEVLDVSYNEIGSHSIDTRRYMCSSPLNHAVGNGDVESYDHWDASLIFKDLNLIQLEIIGNTVVDSQLKAFLFELMPSLEWLDGDNRS